MIVMHCKKGQRGMTIIEALVVAGVISLLAAVAGLMVSRFTVSRTINDITRNISSTLQMAKLKSARDGVEYRAVFSQCDDIDDTDPNCKFCNGYTDFVMGDDTLTITLERGNSNRGSDKWCIESSQAKKMSSNFNLNLTDMAETGPYRCGFSPKGFVVDQNGLPITTDPAPDDDEETVSMLVTPTSTSRVNSCGIVELSPPLARIDVIRGNWDGTDCNPITEP
jgi:type II secretory pathway pseudopilin PulG